jgi:choline dehydrogenase-like flavoprotein
MKRGFDVIVVGSGAGGAPVAYELAKRGRKVLILEAGPIVNNTSLGKIVPAILKPGYYSQMALFSTSVEGTIIYRTSNLGGSTVFSCGCMMRRPDIEEALSDKFGLSGLSLCVDQAAKEAAVRTMAGKTLSPGVRALYDAGLALGLSPEIASKGSVAGKECRSCGKCVFGCAASAKWDSRYYLALALEASASLVTGTKVDDIIMEGNRAVGVVARKGTRTERIAADNVVIAAGALTSPRLLQKVGVSAGKGLFVDYFSCVYGLSEDGLVMEGRSMPVIMNRCREQGVLLSPFLDDWIQYSLFTPLRWKRKSRFSRRRVLGLMVKIADERSGVVNEDGTVSKRPTVADQSRMGVGIETARLVLTKAGCKHLVRTTVWRGAHPGGTAAIGEVVDNNLRVKRKDGLYVCDASIFPFAPGFPPILTITGMGKWLGKRI